MRRTPELRLHLLVVLALAPTLFGSALCAAPGQGLSAVGDSGGFSLTHVHRWHKTPYRPHRLRTLF